MSKLVVSAAASARLCVETHYAAPVHDIAYEAAASARLCVETDRETNEELRERCSRLRAAVC